jgi:hypothetical protein
MKIPFVSLTAALLLISATLVPAQASYRGQRCHVYDDTSFIDIPGQCGNALRYYPRRLFLRPVRYISFRYC